MIKLMAGLPRAFVTAPRTRQQTCTSTMKVVLTGATGFIGGGVLRRCLRLPSITSLVVLSRRELPDAPADPKLKVVIHDDFLRYPDSVLSHTAGADACIWYVSRPRLVFTFSCYLSLPILRALSSSQVNTSQSFATSSLLVNRVLTVLLQVPRKYT
jgi:hypothetical protein